MLRTLNVTSPAVQIIWCAVRAAAIVWAILAFAILAGHNGPTLDIY